MLRMALAICMKDLTLTLTRSAGLVQSLLLGLLLVFLFSLSQKTGSVIPAQTAATIFWLATAFCQVLVFNTLFSYEEADGARTGLILLPQPTAGIWLGKATAGLVVILASQIVFLPATIVFLGQSVASEPLPAAAMILLTDIGLAAMGALLGALAQGQETRESLLSILVFPLLVPLLLSAISLTSTLFGEPLDENVGTWLGFAGAYDSIFLAAGLLLFRFIYTGEE